MSVARRRLTRRRSWQADPMPAQPDDVTPKSVPDDVATGRSSKTPAVALGATVVVVAILFVVALAVVAFAYALAG